MTLIGVVLCCLCMGHKQVCTFCTRSCVHAGADVAPSLGFMRLSCLHGLATRVTADVHECLGRWNDMHMFV